MRTLALAAAVSVSFLGSSPSWAATDTYIGNTGNTTFATGFNTTPSNGDTLVFEPAGSGGTTVTNGSALTVGAANTDGIDFLASASAYTISGSALTLASTGTGIGINDLSLNTETISAPLVLNSAQTVNVGSLDGSLTLNAISGAFTLTKTGAGVLTLNSGATFSNLIIQGGEAAAAGDNNLGTGAVTIDGGILRLSLTTGGFAFSPAATRNFNLGDASAGTGGIIDSGGSNETIAGALANNGGANSFTKAGGGTLTLTGTNTYTGATIISGGTLQLDYNAKGNTTPSINAASTLMLGSTPPTGLIGTPTSQQPTFYTQTLSSAATTQTFNGLTLNPGTGNIAARGINTFNMTLALGAITHNMGGSVNFTRLTAGGTGSGVFTTTTANGTVANAGVTTTGILGGWAVINAAPAGGTAVAPPTDYAANDGSGNIVAYTGYTPIATGATIASAAASNLRVTTTGAVALATGTGTTDINTLSLAPAATGATTVTLASGSVLRLGAFGGLLTGSGSGQLNIGSGANNGTLTAGGADNTAGEITVQSNQQIDINSTLADNGTGAVTLSINAYSTPSGNQTVILSGNNTYTGGTFLSSGRTLANTATAFGTGTVTVAPGAQAYLNAAAFANNFNISGGGGGTGGFDTPAAIRMQGGQTLTGKITLLGDAFILGSGTDTLSGQLTGGYNLSFGRSAGGGAGGGTIILANTSTNANNYTGNTTLTEGTLQLGAPNQIPDGAGNGNLVLSGTINNNATFNLAGFSDTINGLSGVAAATVGSSTVTSTTGTSILTVGGNDQTSVFNGLVTQSGTGTLGITKTGAGLLTLGDVANTYTGGTTVNGGTLRLSAASGATNSTIGAITGALAVNAGTLDLNGFSQTVGAFSGTGSAGVITSSAAGTPVLTVGNAANTTFAGAIQNGLATMVGLTKQGTGTLDLTGVSTYTGATNVTAGVLQIGSGGNLAASSPVTLSGTASLALGDGSGPFVSQTFNSLTTTSTTPVVGGGNMYSSLTLNNAGNVTYANVFGGAGANQNNLNLIIAGTGTTPTTILSGANTYTGFTQVNGGSTLTLAGGSISGSALTLNSGATLTGSGNNSTTGVVGSLMASGGSAITLAGAGGTALRSAGAITLGGTGTYGAGNYTTLNYTLAGASAVESLNTPMTLTLNSGGAYVNVTNPTTTGTYTLANYASLAGTGSFSLSSTSPGVTTLSLGRNTEMLTVGSTSLTLTIAGAAAPNVAYFNGAVSNVFNDTTTSATRVNFSTNQAGTTDTGNVPSSNTDVLLVANNATANRGTTNITATLGASTTINSLNALSAASGLTSFTLAADGSTLTIAGAADNTPAATAFTPATRREMASASPAGAAPLTVNVPVVVGVNGANQTWTNRSASALTVGGTVTGSGTGAQTLTLVNTGTGATTINGAIGDASGGTLALAVNNTGSGVTTFGAANTYSGGTVLNGGTLTSTVAGGFGTGSVTVNPTNATGTAADNATLNSTGSIGSTAAVTVNSESGDGGLGVGTINFNGATPTIGSLAGNGSAVLNNAGGTTLTIGNGTNNLSATFAGVISNGVGTGSVIKAGTGTETLTGANTYTGTTAVNAGTLAIGAGGSIANATAVTLGSGTASGILALGSGGTAVNQTVAGLTTSGTGAANAVVGGASVVSTLTVNSAAAGTYNGLLGGTGTNQNNLALNDTGAGTLTLAGTNTYTGGTSVGGGATLVDASGNATAFGANVATSTVTVASGGLAQLNVSANPNYAYTFAGSGTVKFNFVGGGSDTTTSTTAFNGFTGTVEIANPGGTNNKLQLTGQTGVSGARLQIDSGGQAFVSSGTTTFGAITIVGGGNGENRGAIRLNNGTLGGNVSLLGNATVGDEGGTLPGNISTGVTGTSTLTMGTGNSQGTALLSGVLSNGTGTLALTQAFGTTTLSNANIYTGATTITGGKLVLTNALAVQNSTVTNNVANGVVFDSSVTGNAFTFGALAGTANLALQNNAATPAAVALTVGTNSGTYSGILSGAGSLTQNGPGTQTLSGANTYTGATTVSGGTLQLGSASALPAAALAGGAGLVVNTGSTLDLNGNNVTLASAPAGTGGVITNAGGGASTLTFSGGGALAQSVNGNTALAVTGGTLSANATSTYTGATTITGGTLNLTKAGSPPNPGNGFLTTGGTLAGTSGITINTGGTLALSASNAISSGAATGGTGNGGTGVTLAGGMLAVATGVTQGQGANVVGGSNDFSTLDVPGLGNLTLTSTSTLSFAGSSGTLVFNGLTLNGNALSIGGTNFAMATGNSSDGAKDRFIIESDSGAPSATDLALITFTNYGNSSATDINLGDGFFEIVPVGVPEPSAWAGVLLGLGALCLLRRPGGLHRILRRAR